MNLLFEALLVISEGESNEVKSKDDKGLVKRVHFLRLKQFLCQEVENVVRTTTGIWKGGSSIIGQKVAVPLIKSGGFIIQIL